MVERLSDALRKAFPTNYRDTSTAAAYAHSILKIKWSERISNKVVTLAGNEPTNNLSPNKYAEESGDGLDKPRKPFGDITRHARSSSGTQMGNDKLDVRGQGDMEKML
ncbi:unnamed protein product [Heterobilharzia americana]|nr:unnamed protein product [Heterobilharzia americana]